MVHARAPIAAFEAEHLAARRFAQPAGEALAVGAPLRFEEGGEGVVYLRFAPGGKRMMARDPVHEVVALELSRPMSVVEVAQPLAIARSIYRAGGEKVLFQSSRSTGQVMVVALGAGGAELDVQLRFTSPECDLDRLGDADFTGRVRLR